MTGSDSDDPERERERERVRRHDRVPPEVVLDVLADRYIRRLLIALLEHDRRGGDGERLSATAPLDRELSELRLSIVHKHLPKLALAGFVEWDETTDEVRRGPRFGEIEPLLELMRDHADELPGDWL